MRSANQNIAIIEAFAHAVDTGTLLKQRDAGKLAHQRKTLSTALRALLVWQRPELETTRGLDWPYRVFSQRANALVQLAQAPAAGTIARDRQKEALLFLAMLPFPGQWRWLGESLRKPATLPEIRAYLAFETRTLEAKLAKKSQKTHSLRHFCQILKKPNISREKGVLRIFSMPYIFSDEALLKEVSRFFILYVEPPMGVVFRHAWLRLFCSGVDPCLFGVGGDEDAAFIASQPNTMTTHLAHGHYLDAGSSRPPRSATRYDLVFNATFDDMPRKRHELMLDLLSDPKLLDFKALFLGRGSKENVAAFNAMVRAKHLGERVMVLPNRRRKEIPALLADCRIGVHLSLYENSCRAIYEFMRADIPQVISSSMAGMNSGLFNRQTGLAVQDNELASAIRDLHTRRTDFSPRRWFLANAGSTLATGRLNAILKDLFRRRGYRWTQDIVPLTSSGAQRYANWQDYERFRPDFEMLLGLIENRTRIPIRLSVD